MSDTKKMLKMVYVNGEEAEVGEILADDLKNKDWERCLVPEMLGVPLKVKRFRHRYPNESISRDLGIFLMVNPKNGLADNKWQAECGKIGFARTDGQDFTVGLFYELYDYIYTLMDYYGERNGAAEAIKLMTPLAFKRYSGKTYGIQNEYQSFLQSQSGYQQPEVISVIKPKPIEVPKYTHIFPESTILNKRRAVDLDKLLACKNPLFAKFKRSKLIYSTKNDGILTSAFFARCENVCNALVLIRNGKSGNIFGGFASSAWKQTDQDEFVKDPNAFIFSLVNQEKNPMILDCTDTDHAIMSKPSCGPIFGRSDLRTYNEQDLEKNWTLRCEAMLGTTTYKLDKRVKEEKRASFLGGGRNFLISDMEVYCYVENNSDATNLPKNEPKLIDASPSSPIHSPTAPTAESEQLTTSPSTNSSTNSTLSSTTFSDSESANTTTNGNTTDSSSAQSSPEKEKPTTTTPVASLVSDDSVAQENHHNHNSNASNEAELANCSSCQKYEARLRCSACKKAYYCGIECQRNDWKKHKLECNHHPIN